VLSAHQARERGAPRLGVHQGLRWVHKEERGTLIQCKGTNSKAYKPTKVIKQEKGTKSKARGAPSQRAHKPRKGAQGSRNLQGLA
jgi:hypothetical protein